MPFNLSRYCSLFVVTFWRPLPPPVGTVGTRNIKKGKTRLNRARRGCKQSHLDPSNKKKGKAIHARFNLSPHYKAWPNELPIQRKCDTSHLACSLLGDGLRLRHYFSFLRVSVDTGTIHPVDDPN